MFEVQLDGRSKDLVEENVHKLKELFPEVFIENKVDFEKLQSLLGNHIEQKEEVYKFTWHGKRDSLKKSQMPSAGTLRPCIEESKDWNETENLYIEGDNLEVLKLLGKSYGGKVKMIYIDPPYNKDKDFIYPDKWRDPITEYRKITGQVDEDGNLISSESEDEGGRHTRWLNMMYPRLRLARNLLKGDGVIFISIDDDELENLKKICNEIFGEENFEGHIHWRRRHNQPNDKTKMIGLVTEHILAYAKDSRTLRASGVGKIDLTGSFSNPDNDPLGEWASKPWKVGSDQSGSRYTIVTPSGKELDEEWMGEKETYEEYLKKGRIIFPRGGDGMPRKKYYRFEREEEGQCATNWWSHDVFGHNQGANDCISNLFGMKNVFSNPKPIELIRGLLQIANVKEEDIVMDFFSGTSTTAHSVIAINAEDNHRRKFIMVQLPEDLDSLLESSDSDTKKVLRNAIGFLDSINNNTHSLAEIGKERIRRAGEEIKNELISKYKECQQDTADSEKNLLVNPEDLDIGFKVFKLDSSNLKKWTLDVGEDFHKKSKEKQNAILCNLLGMEVNNLVEGRTELDIVYEIMLKYGFELSCSVDSHPLDGKTVYSVNGGNMVICLDDNIKADFADRIVELVKEIGTDEVRIAVKDLSFYTDDEKTNFKENLKNGINAYFENTEIKAKRKNHFDFITI